MGDSSFRPEYGVTYLRKDIKFPKRRKSLTGSVPIFVPAPAELTVWAALSTDVIGISDCKKSLETRFGLARLILMI